MPQRWRRSPTWFGTEAEQAGRAPNSQQFVDVTQAPIAEPGGARGVILREISRRVGCAQTNARNRFASLDEFVWVAFEVRRVCAPSTSPRAGATLPCPEYLRQFMLTLVPGTARGPYLKPQLTTN